MPSREARLQQGPPLGQAPDRHRLRRGPGRHTGDTQGLAREQDGCHITEAAQPPAQG